MAGAIKKTDNDFLRDKIDLRSGHLPKGNVNVRVLDCFSGRGLLWRGVEKATGRKIVSLPIDIRDDIGFHLHGSNSDFLVTLDLEQYNVIDLDAYGVPFEQLEIIFKKGFKGVVFVTFIQSIYGQLPIAMLLKLGFTEVMIKKIPTLFGKHEWEYFLEYLAKNGVTKIYHRSHSRKHYLCFETG